MLSVQPGAPPPLLTRRSSSSSSLAASFATPPTSVSSSPTAALPTTTVPETPTTTPAAMGTPPTAASRIPMPVHSAAGMASGAAGAALAIPAQPQSSSTKTLRRPTGIVARTVSSSTPPPPPPAPAAAPSHIPPPSGLPRLGGTEAHAAPLAAAPDNALSSAAAYAASINIGRGASATFPPGGANGQKSPVSSPPTRTGPLRISTSSTITSSATTTTSSFIPRPVLSPQSSSSSPPPPVWSSISPTAMGETVSPSSIPRPRLASPPVSTRALTSSSLSLSSSSSSSLSASSGIPRVAARRQSSQGLRTPTSQIPKSATTTWISHAVTPRAHVAAPPKLPHSAPPSSPPVQPPALPSAATSTTPAAAAAGGTSPDIAQRTSPTTPAIDISQPSPRRPSTFTPTTADLPSTSSTAAHARSSTSPSSSPSLSVRSPQGTSPTLATSAGRKRLSASPQSLVPRDSKHSGGGLSSSTSTSNNSGPSSLSSSLSPDHARTPDSLGRSNGIPINRRQSRPPASVHSHSSSGSPRTPSPSTSISPPTISLVEAAANAAAAQRRIQPPGGRSTGDSVSKLPGRTRQPSPFSVLTPSSPPRAATAPFSPPPDLETVLAGPTSAVTDLTSRPSSRIAKPPVEHHLQYQQQSPWSPVATLSPPVALSSDVNSGGSVNGEGKLCGAGEVNSSSHSGAVPATGSPSATSGLTDADPATDAYWPPFAPRRGSGNNGNGSGLSSSRSDRKSPGLTISPPPPPPSSSRLSLAPPPAVPAKSPLRQLTGGSLSRQTTRRSVIVPLPFPSLTTARSSWASSEPSTGSTAGADTPKTPNVKANGTPVDSTSPAPPSSMTMPYPPALLTSWSSPAMSDREEMDLRSSPMFARQDSAPPSTPAESANNWVVGNLHPTESPQDISPLTPFNGSMRSNASSFRGVPEASPWSPGANEAEMERVKALPSVPPMSIQQQRPSSPKTPTTPVRPPIPHRNIQTRSPSMPTLSASGRRPTIASTTDLSSIVGLSPGGRGPATHSGLPSAGTRAPVTPGRRPQSMLIAGSTPISQKRSPSLSKRTHLLREIAATERAHATDLALICDAYMPLDEADLLRSESHQSSTNSDGTTLLNTPDSRRQARRASSYGMPDSEDIIRRTSAHDKRMSGMDWNGTLPPGAFKAPSTHASSDSLGQSSASTTSLSTARLPTPSPRFSMASSNNSSPGSAAARMLPPVGLPLSKADRKAVFLNLRELAALADELATGFENALGGLDDETGESGSDLLGYVFSQMLPRVGPLFMYYCPRQSAASQRLVELQSNPMHAAHFNECWLRVKAYTHAWNLESMLIKPVQRITKYPLLFEDLLSCTTPVHPDYYAIRAAAEGARALALEIDEAKRRKDVITSVIGKSPSMVGLVKDPRATSNGGGSGGGGGGGGGRLLALRRFKKDRSPMASGGPSPGDSTTAPRVISPYAQTQLTELVHRLNESEKLVHRLGKEILVWREKCQIVIKNEADLNLHFLNWYTLDGKVKMDPQTAKVAAYQALISELASTVWKEMESDVCGGSNQNSRSVMLMLGALMDAAKNPKMIIDKLNKKSSDYARYVAVSQAKKTIERTLLLEASEYVAIHTQLLEELPAFLEGYTRIVEIAVAAFVGAQVRYFGAMRERIVKYTNKFLTVPTDEQVTDRGDIRTVQLDVSTFRGIHKAWIDRFREPHMMMKNLEITGGDGQRIPGSRSTSNGTRRTTNTTASTSSRPNTTASATTAASSSRTTSSGKRSPGSEFVAPPLLRHTPSLTSNRSASIDGSSHGRRRSSSPQQPDRRDPSARAAADARGATSSTSTTLRTPHSSVDGGGLSGLLRRNSQKGGRGGGGSGASSIKSGVANFASRSVTNLASRSVTNLRLRQTVQRNKSQTRSSTATSNDDDRHSFGLPHISTNDPLFDGLSLNSSATQSMAHTPIYESIHGHPDYGMFSPIDMNYSSSGLQQEYMADDLVDPGDTWRDSPVLYSCAAVADFNPLELGNHKFQGLMFLPLAAGDLVDVFHEIGRVADLNDFPYSQVGVENDGAVVCRAESGLIGVCMCSFLEPLSSS